MIGNCLCLNRYSLKCLIYYDNEKMMMKSDDTSKEKRLLELISFIR